nr:hypothetical protein [Micromonospora sp. NBS 11-29]
MWGVDGRGAIQAGHLRRFASYPGHSDLCATTVAWPHTPVVVDYHATEGRSWRLRLSRDGAQVPRFARGAASDLVLFFYGRIPLDSLTFEGDRRVFDQLAAWDPSV